MLILTRKVGESINIGNDIKVTVVSFEGGQVRLGIEAPRDVIVHREEIYNRIVEENRKAMQTNANVELLRVAKMLQDKQLT